MPIYEYLCGKCGVFELMQRITENPLTQCPTCRRKVSKLISRGAFQLKGSGWYLTDYARKAEGWGKGESESKDQEKKTDATDAGGKAESTDAGGKPAGESGSGKGDKKRKKAGATKAAAA